MSFTEYKDTIVCGDTVILYLGYDNMQQFCVEKAKIHQTKFGSIKHDDLIGVKFGSKIACSRGYVYVLHPTPELWTVNLPHRTQILYSTDISMITLQLDLKPGCIVLEAGTGSASLSHAILRTIAPNGRLHTYDFHEQRVAKARDEFLAHGFGDMVSASQRDVCSEGFTVTDSIADAVFLDLPCPWQAIPFAAKALVPGGRICSFSPCIEQVQRSCAAMRDNGFNDITTMECLNRQFDVKTVVMTMPDLGYGPGKCFGRNEVALSQPVVGHVEIGQSSTTGRDATTDVKQETHDSDNDDIVADSTDTVKEQTGRQRPEKASYVCKTCKPATTMTGHTGYLTFATLYP